MSEKIEISEDYKEAFNLGYELAKELKLQSPMFKSASVENMRLSAIIEGMAEYDMEIKHVMIQVQAKERGSNLSI